MRSNQIHKNTNIKLFLLSDIFEEFVLELWLILYGNTHLCKYKSFEYMELYNVDEQDLQCLLCLWCIFMQHNHLMKGFKKPIDIYLSWYNIFIKHEYNIRINIKYT